MAESHESVLMASPLFRGFTEDGARSVLATGEVVTLQAGTVLFEEGDSADLVAFLLDGELEAYLQRNDGELVVGTMGAGSLVGELAVLCEAPRAASVRVKQEATVLRWDARGFRLLLLRNSQLSRSVFSQAMRVVLDNQQAMIEELLAKAKT